MYLGQIVVQGAIIAAGFFMVRVIWYVERARALKMLLMKRRYWLEQYDYYATRGNAEYAMKHVEALIEIAIELDRWGWNSGGGFVRVETCPCPLCGRWCNRPRFAMHLPEAEEYLSLPNP